MAQNTKIEWADLVWNPISGCSEISVGCKNCYARRWANRLKGRSGYPLEDPFQVILHPDKLAAPFKWKRPRRVFVCSMGDIFHDDVRVDWIDLVFGIIENCKHHIFMILTKRPENIKEKAAAFYHNTRKRFFNSYMPENVWLGVSVENQETADKRIPILLNVEASIRFVSVEPMLEAIDISKWSGIDWIICGAETGPGARPFDLAWARDLRNQCEAAGVPFFFKSAGKQPIPDGLMIREFPKGGSNGESES